MKKKALIITLLVILLAGIIASFSYLIYYNRSENNFKYITPEIYSTEELIDKDVSKINFTEADTKNFSETEMKIVNATYGNMPNISTTLIDVSNLSKVYNLPYVSYLTPIYKKNKIDHFIFGGVNEDNKNIIAKFNKHNRVNENYSMKQYDHEVVSYKGNDYILDGDQIWVESKSSEEKLILNSSMNYGFPATKDDEGNYISDASSGYHFNSFDIYGQNILINSRDYGTIFSLNAFNDDGTLKEDIELNWVLCGNSITPWYIAPNNGENPIIANGENNDLSYFNYDENPLYTPVVYEEWNDKLLKIEVENKIYDFTNLEDAKDFNLLNNVHKFWGEHTVRIINTYLNSVSETLNGYNPDHLYISIHDNHFPSDAVYRYTDDTVHGVNWGEDPYSYHAYTDKTKNLFGDNSYSIVDDENSYTKVYEIDEENLVAKEVLNINNQPDDSVIDEFSDYRSSSTFFSINGQSYLITESSLNSSFSLSAFDGIDFENGTLKNRRTILDVQWTGIAGGYFHYRTYPIFKNTKNVYYGWNIINDNPYKG